MLWPRVPRLGLRLLVAVIGITAVCCLAVRAYVEYEIHRATSLLAEASRVRVGDAETTVLSLVEQYRGVKWPSDPLGPRENWIDKDEYDYQKNLISDYRYSFEVSPYDLIPRDVRSGQNRFTRVVRAVMNNTPVQPRSVFGMRNWGVEVDVAIRDGRVQSVLGMVVVEGRTRWLGHEWKLANAMPARELQAKVFVIDSAILDMATNSGSMIENHFTPRASDEEVQVSRKFNTACLTRLRGCDGFCDFVPRALEYVKGHPDAAGNFIPPRCP